MYVYLEANLYIFIYNFKSLNNINFLFILDVQYLSFFLIYILIIPSIHVPGDQYLALPGKKFRGNKNIETCGIISRRIYSPILLFCKRGTSLSYDSEL